MTATEGWVFGGSKESCDTACDNYSTGWTCDVNELHMIISEDTFLAARNEILNCDFPSGDCEAAVNVFVNSDDISNKPFYPYVYVGSAYHVNTQPDSTCPFAGTSGLARRLCYCKSP
jgi:hypothetical protein